MKYLNLIIILLSLLILGCQSSTDKDVIEDQNIEVPANPSISDEAHLNKVKKIFYNLPSVIEVSSMLKTSGIDYNFDFLNHYKKVDQYTTLEEMSINLGVYGADLSYTRLYDQLQESVNYFAAIKRLSDNLGIPQDQGGAAAERLERNLENPDSLLNIITQTYSDADAYLKQNDRGNIASLIVMGSWVEALYIATHIASIPDSKEAILNSIALQKYSLDNLIGLLSEYSEDEMVQAYITQLNTLQQAYEKIEIQQTDNIVTKDTVTGVITFDNESVINMSDEDFKTIKAIVEEIRQSII